jgi:hypothetical protein
LSQPDSKAPLRHGGLAVEEVAGGCGDLLWLLRFGEVAGLHIVPTETGSLDKRRTSPPLSRIQAGGEGQGDCSHEPPRDR